MGFVDGAGEAYYHLVGELDEEVNEVEIFAFVRAKEEVLDQGGDGVEFFGDGDAVRVAEGGTLESFDFGGHRCGEEHCSSGLGEDFEDFGEYGGEV